MQQWQRGEYLISTDREQLDVGLIHRFLSGSAYWALGRARETVERSIEHSLPFGLYRDGAQVGFARVITDYATFAYLADVFVVPEFRGQGLSVWLMEVIKGHPQLQGFRRWVLATKDAHGLYRKFDFEGLKEPNRWMERFTPSPLE
ncbi:MAG: GNAT family N-acetyltransferase [Bryobacteraceae bacterium]